MATTLPSAAMGRGMEDGRTNASRIPVTAALRSPTVLSFLMTRRHRNSLRTQEATVTAATCRTLGPNTTTEATSAGTSETMTSSMTFRVAALP